MDTRGGSCRRPCRALSSVYPFHITYTVSWTLEVAPAGVPAEHLAPLSYNMYSDVDTRGGSYRRNRLFTVEHLVPLSYNMYGDVDARGGSYRRNRLFTVEHLVPLSFHIPAASTWTVNQFIVHLNLMYHMQSSSINTFHMYQYTCTNHILFIYLT